MTTTTAPPDQRARLDELKAEESRLTAERAVLLDRQGSTRTPRADAVALETLGARLELLTEEGAAISAGLELEELDAKMPALVAAYQEYRAAAAPFYAALAAVEQAQDRVDRAGAHFDRLVSDLAGALAAHPDRAAQVPEYGLSPLRHGLPSRFRRDEHGNDVDRWYLDATRDARIELPARNLPPGLPGQLTAAEAADAERRRERKRRENLAVLSDGWGAA